MHVEGFKSYRDRTSTEPFDPGLNVIGKHRLVERIQTERGVVGANGSGKTNLFHGNGGEAQLGTNSVCDVAIRFVVSDVFAPLRQEERQQLLHVGYFCRYLQGINGR